ncbi:AMP dependent ligase [Cladochytrium replicatum]|nr:AMP dependent ligase [Cladochytrium replicatum]
MSCIRFVTGGYAFTTNFQIRPGDRIYCCMPVYHSAALVAGVVASWYVGGTVILAPKFSASTFFADCHRYNATAAQYIGELCRYLLASPKSPYDTAHTVRLMYGNGLRPDVWVPFIKRFQIRQIGEFYASSEGPGIATLHCSTVDFSGRVVGTPYPGAVGRIGALIGRMIKIVKVDPVTGELKRGKDGFLIECQKGEAGEYLGRVDPNSPFVGFLGYHKNKEATEKKIAHDCFEKGDMFVRTGDLVRLGDYRYLYFVDRIGDTFRWKVQMYPSLNVCESSLDSDESSRLLPTTSRHEQKGYI